MPFRRADGRFDRVERLDGGRLRIPANLTRTGVLVYRKADGTEQRELRIDSEVFHEDSIATARAMPVTHLHPPTGKVTAANHRELARGHVADNVRQDGKFLAGDVVVSDRDAVDRVDAGALKELSCGYECDLDFTPGEHNGERYDAVQRRIRYNHVALLPAGAGRAGSEVSLRLDAAGNEITGEPSTSPAPRKETPIMKTIRIDGIDYPVDSDAAAQAFKKFQERADANAKKLEETSAALSKAEARADAAEAKVKDLETKLDEATSPKALDERVKARADMADRARKLAPELKIDGLTEAEIRKAALEAKGIKLDGKDDAYIAARFDAEVDKAPDAPSTSSQFRRDTSGAPTSGSFIRPDRLTLPSSN